MTNFEFIAGSPEYLASALTACFEEGVVSVNNNIILDIDLKEQLYQRYYEFLNNERIDYAGVVD